MFDKKTSGIKIFAISAFGSMIPAAVLWIIYYGSVQTLPEMKYRVIIAVSIVVWNILVCVIAKYIGFQKLNSLTSSLPLSVGMIPIFLWQDELKTIWLVLSLFALMIVTMLISAIVVTTIEGQSLQEEIKKQDDNIKTELWTKKEEKEVKDFVEF